MYRTSLRQDDQHRHYPPPTSPNFEDTLQREEDREGGAEALHHVLGLGRVTSELEWTKTLVTICSETLKLQSMSGW